MCLVVKRTSVFSTMYGQTSRSMLLQLLPGAESENPRSSTIGSDGWLLNTIVLRNSYLAGLSTDRAPAATLRLPMNFLMPHFTGLAIQIHGSEQHGRRAKDWRSLLGIGEPCLSWMGWSRSKIPLAHKKGGYGNRPFRHYCESLLLSIWACVITTRMPVADLSDHEGSSALRCHLEHLSSHAGAQLLRALGVMGDEAELRSASDEFSGHCLALTLLGSYLTDAYHGDILCRKE